MQVTINQQAREAVVIKDQITPTIQIKETTTSVITITAQGPIGPQGPMGYDTTDFMMYYKLSKGQS